MEPSADPIIIKNANTKARCKSAGTLKEGVGVLHIQVAGNKGNRAWGQSLNLPVPPELAAIVKMTPATLPSLNSPGAMPSYVPCTLTLDEKGAVIQVEVSIDAKVGVQYGQGGPVVQSFGPAWPVPESAAGDAVGEPDDASDEMPDDEDLNEG